MAQTHLGHTISENTDHVPLKKLLCLSTGGLTTGTCVEGQEDWEVKSLRTAPSWWQMESEGKITSFLALCGKTHETCSSQCLNVSHWGWALLVHSTPYIAFRPFLVIFPLSITHFSWYYVPNKLQACKSCFKYTSGGTQLRSWYVQNSQEWKLSQKMYLNQRL